MVGGLQAEGRVRDDIPDAVSPFAKVQSVSSVYFPQFDGAIKELSIAANSYRLWISEAAQRRAAGNVTGINEGFPAAYRPYCEKRDTLVNELKKFAHKEFQDK